MFMPGFSVGSRIVNFVYKGAVFAFIGEDYLCQQLCSLLYKREVFAFIGEA